MPVREASQTYIQPYIANIGTATVGSGDITANTYTETSTAIEANLQATEFNPYILNLQTTTINNEYMRHVLGQWQSNNPAKNENFSDERYNELSTEIFKLKAELYEIKELLTKISMKYLLEEE